MNKARRMSKTLLLTIRKSTKLTRYGDFYICLVYPFVSENGNEGQRRETLGPGTEIMRLDIVRLAPISPSRDSKLPTRP